MTAMCSELAATLGTDLSSDDRMPVSGGQVSGASVHWPPDPRSGLAGHHSHYHRGTEREILPMAAHHNSAPNARMSIACCQDGRICGAPHGNPPPLSIPPLVSSFSFETNHFTDMERPTGRQLCATELAVYVHVPLWFVLIWNVVAALAAHPILSLYFAATERFRYRL